ncbi:hypothetical protein I2F27_01635 [Acinetobacter sp. B5B]|uniref:hypothetical protein n=1 Tax=Acinetobacter baretiae TaxID=2605383 RepID=UPI0018C3092E|nr:hypothetical protein [Acinetobacter baretiae]MBF7682040.1 hypothetical protein [Acinetobacter baretiae]
MTTEQCIPTDIFIQDVQYTRTHLSFCSPNVESLKIWLDTTHQNAMGDRSKALLQALIELSELDIASCLRFTLVQTIHHSIDQVIEDLKVLIKEQSTSNALHKENILDLIESFRCYMAQLYLDIFIKLREDMIITSFSFRHYLTHKKQNTCSWYACYLALEQFSLLTCHQHMVYKEALDGQWQRTHYLYWCARQHQYQNIEIYDSKDCICSQNDIHSISILYKQILLLHLLNTRQVRPSETYALYQCSAEWAHLLRVTPKKNPLSRYTIQPQTDRPPTALLEEQENTLSKNYFYINVNHLFKRIQLANSPTQSKLSIKEQLYLSSSLIFHITNTLNQSPERRYTRYNFNSSIQICFGLKSVHHLLAQAIRKHQNQRIKQSKRSNTPQEIHHIIPKHTVSNANLDFDENIYTCRILDVSVNGYRMLWKGHTPKHLRAGEFLAVQENSQSPWRCGLIRWIKQRSDKNLEFGVEIISQNITLCYIQKSNNMLENNTYSPALLLKKDILDQAHFFLAIPTSDSLNDQKHVQLYLMNQIISVYLNDTELENPSFILCNFEVLTLEDTDKFNYLTSEYDRLLKSVDL